MGRESELVDYPPDDDPDGQVEALAKWIADVEATFSAAVLLEPLDLYGVMTDEGCWVIPAYSSGQPCAYWRGDPAPHEVAKLPLVRGRVHDFAGSPESPGSQ